ncbi:MAG: hypothetical protein H0W31_01155 [Actinobacteria bacterium]|nr:hypothetical protein [Actinomycetota bacterium]
MIVYAVVDDALSPDFPLGVELEVFVRRDDAERFVEEGARGAGAAAQDDAAYTT